MMLPETTLKELVQKCTAQDREAFRRLFELMNERVFAYVRSRVTSRDDALDVTQQTFIELWRSLPRFAWKSEPQFYGFLFTITKRTVTKHYRMGAHAPERIVFEEDLVGGVMDGDLSGDMERALSTLAPIDRDILILHHWSRYTFGEIGEMLTLTESAVRVRHHRALKTLRPFFTETT